MFSRGISCTILLLSHLPGTAAIRTDGLFDPFFWNAFLSFRCFIYFYKKSKSYHKNCCLLKPSFVVTQDPEKVMGLFRFQRRFSARSNISRR